MKFSDITLVTGDVARLRAFYERALRLPAQGDDDHAWISLGSVGLVFDSLPILRASDSFSYVAPGASDAVILSFDVESVDDAYREVLSLGAPVLRSPTTHPWGARSFQFRDPDGNILNFRSRAD